MGFARSLTCERSTLQRAILNFRRHFREVNRQKEIYFSIIHDRIYIAMTQDKDLLEPSLFNLGKAYLKLGDLDSANVQNEMLRGGKSDWEENLYVLINP